MTNILLSIVIPTYNRGHVLVKNIERLLPQVAREDVELIVLDNCSSTSMKDYIESELGSEVFSSLKVILNPINIGLIGNSLRVFEIGCGEFIWTLCDDDLVATDAVTKVLQDIRANLKSTYLWFPVKGGPAHQKPGQYKGLYKAMEAEPNLFFAALSSCVFRRNFFADRLRFGYLYASSWVPFMCPLIADIDNADNLIFISDQTVAKANKPSADEKWSKLDVCLGIRSLLELPMSSVAKQVVKDSLNSFTFSTARLFLDSVVVDDRQRWELFRSFVNKRYLPLSIFMIAWTGTSWIAQLLPGFTRNLIHFLELLIRRPLLLEVEERFSRS